MRMYIRMNKQQRRIAKALSFLEGASLSPAWDIYQGMASGYEENIIRDIVGQLIKRGSISEKQTSFLSGLMQSIAKRGEREAQRAIEDAAALPFPVTDERVTVSGQVLTTKWQNSRFGDTFKMLVKADAGWKIWITCPDTNTVREDRVTFQAKLQPSRDDAKFGFGSRPSKFRNLTREEDEAHRAAMEARPCHHGNNPAECNDCMVESDFAYDAARGS